MSQKNQTKSFWGVLSAALLAYALLIGIVIRHYEWDVSSLIVMGSAPYSDVDLSLHPPHPGVVVFEDGAYDGQYYYWVARSPFVVLDFIDPYRYQRILLPVMAHLLAGGDTVWIPHTLLITNLLFLLGGTALVAWHLKDRGMSPWWSLIFALNIGMISSILTTLTEPSFLFFGALAFVLWSREKFGWAALALAVGMLAREITILFILPLILWSLWHRRWRVFFYLILTGVPFVAYQYALFYQTGTWQIFSATENNLGLPFAGVIEMAMKLPEYSAQGMTGILKYINFIPVLLFLLLLALEGTKQGWTQFRDRWDFKPFTILLWAQIAMGVMVYWGPWESITGMGRVIAGVFLLLPFAWTEEGWGQKISLTAFTALLSVMGLARLFIAHPHPYHITF